MRVLILAVTVTSAELGLTVGQTIEMDINYNIYSPLSHHLAAAILWFPYPGSVVTMGGRPIIINSTIIIFECLQPFNYASCVKRNFKSFD